jgi:phage-related protein
MVRVDREVQTQAMDGLAQSVGNGITGLVSGAFDAIGAALRGIVNAGNQALPGGLFFGVVFVLLVAAAWTLAKR